MVNNHLFLTFSRVVVIFCFLATAPLRSMASSLSAAEVVNLCKCGKNATQRCSACKTVWYCGAQCQKNDWAQHKKRCAELCAFKKTLDEVFKKEPYVKVFHNPPLLYRTALDRVDVEVISGLVALKLFDLATTPLRADGITAMFYLVETRNCKGLAHLIKSYHGLLEVRDKQGLTPMHVACQDGAGEVVSMFLDMCAPTQVQGELTPEWKQDCIRAFSFYFKDGEEFQVSKGLFGTPLHVAAMFGNLGCVKLLVEKGNVPVDVLTDSGASALVRAVHHHHTEVAKYLVNKGARIDAAKQTSLGGTLLHHVFGELCVPVTEARKKMPSKELLRFLLEDCMIDVNERNLENETPLQFVIYLASAPAAKLLIEECKADRSVLDARGRNILELACDLRMNNPHKDTNVFNYEPVIRYLASFMSADFLREIV